jgi:hypothetical protein
MRKREVQAELDAVRELLAEAIEQRDVLLVHCTREDGSIPAGTYGPVGRMIDVPHPSGLVRLTPGDTISFDSKEGERGSD